jgi:gliding motility-associated-like protein
MRNLVLIIVAVLLHLYSFSQSCTDTSFRRIYSSLDAGLANYDVLNNKDTTILLGKYSTASNSAFYLAKILSSGNQLWAKSFNSNSLFPFNMIELENKDLLVAYPGTQTNSIVCTKFNKSGDLIWSKEIFISDNTSDFGGFCIREYQHELYAYYSGQFGEYINCATSIIKMDTACNIIWARYYIDNNRTECNVTYPVAMCEVNDSLIVFGRVSPQYCTYIDATTESSYYAMKISKQTGALGRSVAYRNPIDIGNNLELFGTYALPINNITITDSGQCFYAGEEGIKRNDIKIRFDTNLNVYEGYEYGNAGSILYIGRISVDMQGDTYLFYRNNTSPNNYIARFNTSNKLLLQKELNGLGIAANSIINNKFIYKKNYTCLLASTKTLGSSHLEQYQLRNEVRTGDCFGKDTNFVLIKPYPFKIENSAFFTDAYDLPIDVKDGPDINLNDIVISKQDVCQQISNCDYLKIQQQTDTVCTSIKTFKAHKNGDCYRHIYWQVDSTAIDSVSIVNNSTLAIRFKETWKDTAWLYASVNSCMDLKDSIKVYQNITAKNSVTLGGDTTLCKGNQLYLNATSGFKTYLWQDGSADSFFVVKQGGRYFVTAIDYCSNRFSDTIIVAFDSPLVYLGKDTSICNNTTIVIAPVQTFASYLWSTGSASNNISINEPGDYWLRVTDDNLCYGTDTIRVSIKNCGDYFFMPNSFTPNNDGLNDKIRPIVTGDINTYEFSIYNRYGQLVFTTKNMQDSWDGNFNGKQQNSGVFVWYCHYDRKNEIEKLEKGTVFLVR